MCVILSVDLVAMSLATESFDAHNLRGRNDNVIDIIDMIRCLKTMYERIEAKHQKLVNVALCVDLVLNWILNVYDMSVADWIHFNLRLLDCRSHF